MNHVIQNPKGVDIPIQRLQTLLFEALDWSDSDFYGRVFRIKSSKGYLIRAFNLTEGYTDVFTDDNKSAKVFFIVGDEITSKSGLLWTATVKVVVMANIGKILSQKTSRADSDLQAMMIQEIRKTHIINLDKGGIETGVDKIFQGYDLSVLSKVDVEPYHVFAIKGTISYHLK